MIRRLCVVGLGLLGGSVARAARARGLAGEIAAVGRSRGSLAPALADGVVDEATTDLAAGLAGADLVLLATPVAALEALLPEVWRHAGTGVVITDVGSTKARIVATAERLAGARPLAFVGGHPMAGSHLGGYPASRPDLFEGARVILTPTEATSPEAAARVRALWEALGGRVLTLDPASHDRAMAAVSHLPHLVADALVDAVVSMDPSYLEVAARGFRDTTRVAAAVPEVWQEIFQENRAALAEALTVFRKCLDHLEGLVQAEDAAALVCELGRIRDVRARLG